MPAKGRTLKVTLEIRTPRGMLFKGEIPVTVDFRTHTAWISAEEAKKLAFEDLPTDAVLEFEFPEGAP